uniref:Ig-like domain-containing protein n=1 Tax=Anopheles merus TaxID=30066 RepID=A0A182ULY5_ANOME
MVFSGSGPSVWYQRRRLLARTHSTDATLAHNPPAGAVQRGKDATVAARRKMTITGEGSRSASRWWCCSQKAPNHHQLARDSRKRTRHRTTHKRRESAMKRTKTAATTTTARMEGTVVPSILELPPTDSCSHTSFNYKFYRYQYLRPVAILYIALAVILANVSAFEPDFVYPLENVTVAKGRDATFTCVVNNLGGYRVSGEATPARVAWIKADAKAILAIHEHVITNNGRLSVTHNDYNTWTLVIRNVKMEDRGVYMCQVNTDPMKMQTAFLEVVIPPDIIYEETSGDMMVPEGGSAKLICKARGYPKPKIVWRREDGREIIARNGTHGKMKATIVEGEMLSLTKVTRSEMGAYMCIASNGVPPSVSKRLKLQVHCK